MIVVEVLGGAMVMSLFLVATVGLWIGLLASLGAVRITRCERCGHLGLASRNEHLQRCARCRHEHLLHPIAMLHEGHRVEQR